MARQTGHYWCAGGTLVSLKTSSVPLPVTHTRHIDSSAKIDRAHVREECHHFIHPRLFQGPCGCNQMAYKNVMHTAAQRPLAIYTQRVSLLLLQCWCFSHRYYSNTNHICILLWCPVCARKTEGQQFVCRDSRPTGSSLKKFNVSHTGWWYEELAFTQYFPRLNPGPHWGCSRPVSRFDWTTSDNFNSASHSMEGSTDILINICSRLILTVSRVTSCFSGDLSLVFQYRILATMAVSPRSRNNHLLSNNTTHRYHWPALQRCHRCGARCTRPP